MSQGWAPPEPGATVRQFDFQIANLNFVLLSRTQRGSENIHLGKQRCHGWIGIVCLGCPQVQGGAPGSQTPCSAAGVFVLPLFVLTGSRWNPSLCTTKPEPLESCACPRLKTVILENLEPQDWMAQDALSFSKLALSPASPCLASRWQVHLPPLAVVWSKSE